MGADRPAPEVLLRDKANDADFICQGMEDRGGVAMIPAKRNRLIQLPVDAAIYALPNIAERCFNELRNARRFATRYHKTADSDLSCIHSGASDQKQNGGPRGDRRSFVQPCDLCDQNAKFRVARPP